MYVQYQGQNGVIMEWNTKEIPQISEIVRVLWLADISGRILQYGPLYGSLKVN